MNDTGLLVTSVDKINYMITKHCGSSEPELRAISSHIHQRLKELRDAQTRTMMNILVTGQRVIISPRAKKLGGKRGVVTKVNRTRIQVTIDGLGKTYNIPARLVTVDKDHPEIVMPVQSVTRIKTKKTSTDLPKSERACKQLYLQLEQEHNALQDRLHNTKDETKRSELRQLLDRASDRLHDLGEWLGKKFGFDVDDAMNEDFC